MVNCVDILAYLPTQLYASCGLVLGYHHWMTSFTVMMLTGVRRVQLYLKDCPGFDGYVYDSYTGWNTVSRIIIEEVPPSE